MRVLHLSSEYPPQRVYGLGRFVRDLAGAATALGDEVHVLTNSLGGADQDILADGVHVHRIDFPNPPKPPDSPTQVMQFNMLALQRFTRIAERIGPIDVVNAHDWLMGVAGRAVRRLHGAPLVATIHDTVVGKTAGDLTNPQRYEAGLERLTCRWADRVICCSEYVRCELTTQYDVPADRVCVIPCAVDAGSFAPPDPGSLPLFKSAVVKDGERLVVYVGRLDPEKGVAVLIDAAARVLGVTDDVRFIVAGTGTKAGALAQRVRTRRLQSKMRLMGYVSGPALAYLYHAADVLVCPSLYEPFGMVALEGMVCGAPVIVSDTGGLAEIVQDGVTGLVTPPGDARPLAEAICRMLFDDALRRALGDAGRQRAREVYTWPNVARQTKALYDEAIGVGRVDPDAP